MKQLQFSPRLARYQRRSLQAEMKSMFGFFLSLSCLLLFITGCSKNDLKTSNGTAAEKVAQPAGKEQSNIAARDVAKMYNNLSPQTLWELQQVRAAIAQYRDLKNALKDGYVNINVDIPMMGHHYMKASLVDNVFDPRHPEILVYNGNEQGEQELLAAEFAVPINYPRPEGFTGSQDMWDENHQFNLWLVHAWVWKYNPTGAFEMMNPEVGELR